MPSNDTGAALLLVLILITSVAMVMGVVLSQVDTNVRSTVQLRDQSAATYAADGAGQLAVDQLRRGAFVSNCAVAGGIDASFGTASAPFYPGGGSPTGALNARVRCTPDTTTAATVVISHTNKPTDALLTVGTSDAEDGQDFGAGAAKKTVAVANGNVRSNSTITSGKDTLAVTGTGVAVQAHTTCDGKFSPTPCVEGAPIRATPAYAHPTDPVTPAPPPVCSGSYAAFRPGLYSDLTYLNGTCGQKSVVWFSPGTYYFAFTGTWKTPATLVGGTPMDSAATSTPITGLDPANPTTLGRLSQLHDLPGACADPRKTVAPGVEFVFGSSGAMDVGANAMELCATYVDAVTTPIALYGLPSDTTPFSNGGTGSIGGQSGCVTLVGGCSLVQTDVNGHARIYINGFTYAPSARIELTLKNSDGQVFNWGLVLRSFAIAVNGSSPSQPVIQLPGDTSSSETTYTVMYLSVWTCPASGAPCATSGPPQLRAKVQVTGTPPRASVLSWSRVN